MSKERKQRNRKAFTEKLTPSYPSQDVFSPWRQRKLVKHAKGNEDHELRVCEQLREANT